MRLRQTLKRLASQSWKNIDFKIKLQRAIQKKLKSTITDVMHKKLSQEDIPFEIVYESLISQFESIGLEVYDTENLKFPLILRRKLTPQSEIRVYVPGRKIEFDSDRYWYTLSNSVVIIIFYLNYFY